MLLFEVRVMVKQATFVSLEVALPERTFPMRAGKKPHHALVWRELVKSNPKRQQTSAVEWKITEILVIPRNRTTDIAGRHFDREHVGVKPDRNVPAHEPLRVATNDPRPRQGGEWLDQAITAQIVYVAPRDSIVRPLPV